MIKIEYNNEIFEFLSTDEFNIFLKKNSLEVDSDGNLVQITEMGIIPYVIDKWIAERKVVRKQANEAHEKGDKSTFERLNRKQVVLKVLSNSIYGCLGLPIWRWYNKVNASAVTITGQTLIKTASTMVNKYYSQVTDTDNDNVIYIDTDSLFVSSLPLIDKLYPDIDKKDDKAMTDCTLKITTDVQKYINGMFDVMAKRMFNVTNHKFFIKQELISKSAMWLAKKRYMQWVINDAGRTCSKMDVKGIDVVRTSFPPKFGKFMEEIMKLILNNEPVDNINEKILAFEDLLDGFELDDCAKSTSVRFISRKGDKDYNPKSRRPFEVISGSPFQVKSANFYNDMLKKLHLDNVTEPIFDGQKIRCVYLKDNEFGIDCMALKQDGTNPPIMLDLIRKHLDVRKMYEKELKSKLLDFFTILKWDYPTAEGKKAKEFFDF